VCGAFRRWQLPLQLDITTLQLDTMNVMFFHRETRVSALPSSALGANTASPASAAPADA
jgi:hypothetical protein